MNFKSNRFFEYTAIGLISLLAATPSLFIFFSYCSPEKYINYTTQSTLFSEKYWIYYLEFKRNLALGMLNWPSDIDTNGFKYLERILPRILYAPVYNYPSYYFIYDAILLFSGVFLSLSVFISQIRNSHAFKLAILFVFVGFSIYDIRISVLEGVLPELWWSRNIVAILGFSISYYLYEKYGDLRGRTFSFVAMTCILALVHTYSYLLMLTYFLILSIVGLIGKKVGLRSLLALIPSVLVFLYIKYNLTHIPIFQKFTIFYGAYHSYAPNYIEIIKLLGILAPVYFLSRESKFLILIIAALLLSNQQILTGMSLKDIHYRLYFIEWVASIVLIEKLILKLSENFCFKTNLKRIYIYALLFVSAFSIFRLSYYLYTHDYKCENPVNENPMSISLYSYLITRDVSTLVNDKFFVWDAPDDDIIVTMSDSCSLDKLNCRAWLNSIYHLKR